MIITNQIHLSRIFHLTWKIDLILVSSCLMAYLLHKHILLEYFEVPAIMPTIVGTALAFFIGFNSNQAYDRWWEGRKVMGALVNDSRSWTRGLLSYCVETESSNLEEIRKRMIDRHLAFLYALKSSLRNNTNDFNHYLQKGDIDAIRNQGNKHNALLLLQSKDLQLLYASGNIDGFKFLDLNQLLVKFTDEIGMAERIKNTVFPPTYHYFTRLFIWLFAVVFTIVAAETTGAWSIILGWMVGFIFHTSHTLGMILLNPFEFYPTGLPLDQIVRNVEINILEMTKAENIPLPIQPIKGEYIM